MKSILIIGIGQFGKELARGFVERKNQVMAVDIDEEALEDIVPIVDASRVADCTNEKVIDSLGIQEYDMCFVCMGDTDFQSALEITAILKEKGAQYIVSKADSELHERLLKRVGADEVVFPERDIADRCAVKYSFKNIYDYFQLEEGFSMYEMTPIPSWCGKTLIEAQIRTKYNVSIIAIKKKEGGMNINPLPTYVLSEGEKLLVLGHKDDLIRLEKKIVE